MTVAVVSPAGDAMLAAARSLGVPFGRERSVKLSGGRAERDRALLMLSATALGRDPRAGFDALCDRIAAPEAARAALRPQIGAASHVHLGHEGETRKLYLEFTEPAIGDRRLAFLSAKWRPDGACAIGRYRLLDPAEAVRLTASAPPPADAALAALLVAYRPRAGRGARALSVSEEGTPRASLDVRLYGAGLRLADAAEPLRALCAAFGPGETYAETLLDTAGACALGHLSTGLGRDGAPFATLYFGAESA
jgi:hypothetical protein